MLPASSIRSPAEVRPSPCIDRDARVRRATHQRGTRSALGRDRSRPRDAARRSGKDRRWGPHDHLLPVLRDELREHKARGEHTANQLVFATSTGRAVTATNVRKRILQPAIARASETLERQDQIPLPDGITPHALRRTFASLLFAIGESPPYVINQLGHATPALTLEIYARQMNQRDGEPTRLQDLVDGRLQPGVQQTCMFR